MPSITMVDKAITAANNARAELLDAKVRGETGVKVKTIWSMFTGPTGAYITERADGQPMSPELKSYVEGLWAHWLV